MKIFVSYASEQRILAEEVTLALRGDGHDVFRDRDELRPGDTFDEEIRAAIAECDLFVFLISAESIRSGSYARTELELARKRWPHPAEGVLPVMVAPLAMASVPPYLRAVTVMTPSGNAAAEVAAAVAERQDGPSDSTQHPTVSAARVFLLGCHVGGLALRPLAECIRFSQRLEMGLREETRLRAGLRLDRMPLAPMEEVHEAVERQARGAGLGMPAGIQAPELDFDAEEELDKVIRHVRDGDGGAETELWEREGAIDLLMASAREQVTTYWNRVVPGLVTQLDHHPPRHRLAFSVATSLVHLPTAPLQPGPDDLQFQLYRGLGGRIGLFGTKRALRVRSRRIGADVSALDLPTRSIRPFEELARSVLDDVRGAVARSEDPSVADPDFAAELWALMSRTERDLAQLEMRFAAELDGVAS